MADGSDVTDLEARWREAEAHCRETEAAVRDADDDDLFGAIAARTGARLAAGQAARDLLSAMGEWPR
jgi:hypothetical protein